MSGFYGIGFSLCSFGLAGTKTAQAEGYATVNTNMKIILASTSPRRAEILRDAGIPFHHLRCRD